MGGRVWGVLCDAVGWICKREAVLRHSWDSNRVQGQAPGLEQDHDADDYHQEASVHVTRASEAIESNAFWAFLHLLDIFSAWLGHLWNWCRGCPCHCYDDRKKKCAERRLLATCPLLGRRAPEMALVTFKLFAEEIGQIKSQDNYTYSRARAFIVTP